MGTLVPYGVQWELRTVRTLRPCRLWKTLERLRKCRHGGPARHGGHKTFLRKLGIWRKRRACSKWRTCMTCKILRCLMTWTERRTWNTVRLGTYPCSCHCHCLCPHPSPCVFLVYTFENRNGIRFDARTDVKQRSRFLGFGWLIFA